MLSAVRTAGAAAVALGALAAGCGSGHDRAVTSTRPHVVASLAPSGPILVGRGRIARPNEVDRYRFAVAPGTRVSLEARRVRGFCGENQTFTWSLRAPH